MAYSPMRQANADHTATNFRDWTFETTPVPHVVDLPNTSLSLSFEGLTHEALDRGAGAAAEHDESRVSKLLSSLTSSSDHSYDPVEDDDYDMTDQETPTLERNPKNFMPSMLEAQSSQPTSHDTPARTASINRQLPLNHPVPDLQSIQGAYIKNVERLEESAARLSMESNLAEELQPNKHEQRQRHRNVSQSSHGNSIRAGHRRQVSAMSMVSSIADAKPATRPRGHAPSTSGVSPIGSPSSFMSGQNNASSGQPRSSRLLIPLPEPEMEGRPLDSEVTVSHAQNPIVRPPNSLSPSNVSPSERPTTSGSGDTYQQAKSLFTDFDGVHYSPEKGGRERRRISLTRPPRARDSRAFREPQPGEEMIYYPAPVPVMLNLPMRLSKMNWSEHEKRRLKALSGIPDEMRKSAAWLANDDGIPAADSKRKSTALPPQLRASAFFDHRGKTQDVQLKDGSAVATLDSILDAAAHAPVSAFTDHPIAGHLGDDFYGLEKTSTRKSVQPIVEKKSKRRSSISNLLKRKSSANLSETLKLESQAPSVMLSKDDSQNLEEDHVEDAAERSIAPGSDEMSDHERDGRAKEDDGSEKSSESSESQLQPGFSTAPTTLLAELQMRKAQQRSRNRNAADTFPNGVHSTLLELDTVTQLQQKARRQTHVTLAWEDKDVVDKQNYDDEDVPLGILFPEKEQQNMMNHHRPLGLMEKRELEENEPLSQRRARLRGEPLPLPSGSPATNRQDEEASKPRLNLPGLETPAGDDDEEETLAQRRQRMKARQENGTSDDFAQTLSSELGLEARKGKQDATRPTSGSKTPEIEETLGQRRKRLQAEAAPGGDRSVSGGNKVRPALRTTPSLADVLRANPIGHVDREQSETALLAMQTHERVKEREARYLADQEAARQQAYMSLNTFGLGHQSGLIQARTGVYQGYQQPYATTAPPYMAGNNGMKAATPVYGLPHVASVGLQPVQNHTVRGVNNVYMHYAQQHPMPRGHQYPSAVDLSGMGPPLDPKQRARIEGWRQGIM